CPPGRRHGGAEDARVRRRGRIPPQPANGAGAPPPQVARLPPVAEVGRPGQGKSPLAENLREPRCVPCPPTRSTRSTCKRPSPRSTSWATKSRTRPPEHACPPSA